MADIWKDIEKVVEERDKAINDRRDQNVFLVNATQCTRLWKNLRAVYAAFSNSLPIHQKRLLLFKRFYMLVMRVDAILDKCSCEQSWLEAAIFYGDNPHVFKELSLDLQSCMDVFHDIAEAHCNATIKIQEPKVEMTMYDDDGDADFQKDVTKLEANLEKLLKDTDSGENQKHLARYLISRKKRSCLSPNRADLNPDGCPVEEFYEVHRQKPEYLGSIVSGESGASGEVTRVKWLGLITCAQKTLKNPEGVEAFEKEVRTLVALNHPRIVKLLCSIKSCSKNTNRPKLRFVMELMPMSLSAFIKQRKKEQQDKGVSPSAMPFDILPTIEMMLQIASGMDYLHERGVVHRDLKSANVLVAPSTHSELRDQGYADIKLTDFGLAKMKVRDGEVMNPTGKMIGTPKWMAPETIGVDLSERIDWRKADTYSFGITCWETLAGELPYNEFQLGNEVMYQKIKDGSLRPELPPHCPSYLGKLVERCWAHNPKERPSFEEIVYTLSWFRTCLLIGIDPESESPKSALPLWKKLWSFSGNVRTIRFERPPVECRDTTQSVKTRFGDEIEKYIFKKLDMVDVLCSRMKVDLKQVQVCRTQCEHLFQQYFEGVQKVKAIVFDEAFRRRILWDLYRSGKLQQCTGCLDKLICSMMAAEELLRGCGGSEWKRMALSISAPRLPKARLYSIFGFYLWELYWNLFVIHHVMLGTTTGRSSQSQLQVQSAAGNLLVQWCKEKCRLVLRRKADLEDAEKEFLQADVDRQAEDRRSLLARLEKPSAGSLGALHFVVSVFRPSEAANEDGLAACLKKNLQSTSATADLEWHQDCYWIKEGEFQYEKVKLISHYGRKSVFKCNWLGLEVAISSSLTLKREFNSKGETMVRVQHPNVVHVMGYAYSDNVEAEEDNTTEYIFMELMQDNLTNLIERNSRLYSGGPFPLRVATDILLHIVEAMVHLHECGVIHRNLNPSNILVSPKYSTKSNNGKDMDVYYTVKLGSFSSAAMVSNKPFSSAAVYDRPMAGTSRFRAPEVWHSSSLDPNVPYTWSVDVWSFGMTAYHIISGSLPFDDFPLRGLPALVRDGHRPRLPDGCPKDLEELITRCWAVDPQSRPSFEDIRKDLWTFKYNLEITS